MSRFVDTQAGEEQGEENPVEENDALPADEPSVSGEPSSSDDDAPDDYDYEDEFIEREGVPQEADAAEADEEGEEPLKKQKKRRRQLVLEDEDYDLLEENTGIRRVRPQQHRRLKKARDVDGGAGDAQRTAAQLKEELFGPDEDEGLEDDVEIGSAVGAAAAGSGGGASRREAEPAEHDIFNEDDWIVDEFEEAGAEPGERRRRRRAALDAMPGVDPDALDEANDIFGDVDELLAAYEARKDARLDAQGGGSGEDEYAALDEEELSDEEAADLLRRHREERSGEAAALRITKALEPDALERHLMLPGDIAIRAADIPEREQLYRGADPADFDLDACARWVVGRLVGKHLPESKAVTTLADGAREVEGPPPEWMGLRWPADAMREGLTDTSAQRGFYKGRGRREWAEWRENAAAQAALLASVRSALHLLYFRHEEVPLMGMFRKEALGELLAVRHKDEPRKRGPDFKGVLSADTRRARRWDVLYAVQRLSQQWRAMQRQREARAAAYRRALDAAASDTERAAVERCLALLQSAQSVEALDDVEAQFRLAAPPLEELMDAVGVADEGSQGAAPRRRPQRVSALHLAMQAGLEDAIAAIGLSAAQFGRNVEEGFQLVEPEDPVQVPQQLAAAHVDPDRVAARDVAAVLRSIRQAAAAQVAVEPAVRQAVRDLFWESAAVSTHPTPAGEPTLGPFHALGPAKRLRNKALRRFDGGDLFLRVIAAERDGLVTVAIAVPPDAVENCISQLADMYTSSAPTPQAQAWNEVRVGVLREAVVKLLLPGLVAEARARLGAEARAVALQEVSDAAWALATAAQLQIALAEEEGGVVGDRRIMAACYGPGHPATTFVMLDPAGTLVDFLHCGQLSGPIPRRRVVPGQTYDLFTDPKKAGDAVRLRDFIEAHLPHAIVVGMSHPEAKTLVEDVAAIIDHILADNPRLFTSHELGSIATLPVDEAVAAVWENSAAAREELPASPAIVRRAVALARQALDPLPVLASLAGPSKEVLSLPLHPLQASLPEEERLRAVEQAVCSAVAQVGVDLNAVAASPWMAPPLQFVPGLGPRKAAALLQAVARAGGHVESRAQVWRELGVVGNRVFRNAAPFLRVRACAKGSANAEFDPLDDMRVHPESYLHAVAMAQSALGGEGGSAVENALAAPQEVEALELDAYDRHLQGQHAAEAAEGGEGGAPPAGPAGTRLATLIDIQMEFAAPYGELRPPHDPLSAEDTFWLACGESAETVKPGRKVEAVVRYVGDEMARLALPDLNGVEAVIYSSEVSSSAGQGGGDPPSCRHYFKQGDVVTAVIKEVDPGGWGVEVSTASAKLNQDAHWEHKYLGRDEDYKALSANEVAERAKEQRRQAMRASFVTRSIRHPLFTNCSMDDAAARVQLGEVGTAVVRPSTRSLRTLHITILTPGRGVWHIDVKEQGKTGSSLQLAPPLQVEPVPGKSATYDDLDELAARFVDPVAAALRALGTHRKWSSAGSWEAVQRELQGQRDADPSRVAYCLAAEPLRPGAFYLAYITASAPRREFFVVLPGGFYFRKKEHPTVDHMLAAFKRNPLYRSKEQQAAEQQRYQQQQQQQQPQGWNGPVAVPPPPPPQQQQQQQFYPYHYPQEATYAEYMHQR